MRRLSKIRTGPLAIFLVISSLIVGSIVINYIIPDPNQIDHRNPGYPSSYSDLADYQINSETILLSLERKEENVFAPMIATPGQDADLFPQGTFSWTQSDYLKVADALSQYIWKEPLRLENWRLYYIAFHRECQDQPRGFDYMEITYYKEIWSGWKTSYLTRYIGIYPLANQVSVGSASDFSSRYFRGDDQVNFSEFRITADDALLIAEENGGKESRKQIKNYCSILLNAPLRENGYGWGVYYYFDANFEVSINPYTGKFRVLDTGK